MTLGRGGCWWGRGMFVGHKNVQQETVENQDDNNEVFVELNQYKAAYIQKQITEEPG